MAHNFPHSALHRIHSVAYAGTQFDVHLICETPSGDLFPTQLTYGAFSRLIREKTERTSAIALLNAFRQFALKDPLSNMHQWNILDVRGVLGQALQVNADQVNLTPLLHRAA